MRLAGFGWGSVGWSAVPLGTAVPPEGSADIVGAGTFDVDAGSLEGELAGASGSVVVDEVGALKEGVWVDVDVGTFERASLSVGEGLGSLVEVRGSTVSGPLGDTG